MGTFFRLATSRVSRKLGLLIGILLASLALAQASQECFNHTRKRNYLGFLSASESTAYVLWAATTIVAALALLGSIFEVMASLGRKPKMSVRNYRPFQRLMTTFFVLNISVSSIQGYLNSFVNSPAGATVMANAMVGVGSIAYMQFATCSTTKDYFEALASCIPLAMSSFSTQAALSTYGSVGPIPGWVYLMLMGCSVAVAAAISLLGIWSRGKNGWGWDVEDRVTKHCEQLCRGERTRDVAIDSVQMAGQIESVLQLAARVAGVDSKNKGRFILVFAKQAVSLAPVFCAFVTMFNKCFHSRHQLIALVGSSVMSLSSGAGSFAIEVFSVNNIAKTAGDVRNGALTKAFDELLDYGMTIRTFNNINDLRRRFGLRVVDEQEVRLAMESLGRRLDDTGPKAIGPSSGVRVNGNQNQLAQDLVALAVLCCKRMDIPVA